MHEELLAAIRGWDGDGNDRWGDPVFDRFAAEIHRHQYENVVPYRQFCDRRDVGPTVASYIQIPAVPTDVFKHVRLFAGDDDEIVRTFRTSGTTQDTRGAHHFRTLEFYRSAIHGPFRRFVAGEKDSRYNVVVLAPSPGLLPDSSLSFMLGELVERWGNPMGSGFFVEEMEDDELAFDFDGVVDLLDRVTRPTMLLGTAFAFVEFFEAVDGHWNLPEGSRVMETGGLKGRTREVSRAELYAMFRERLGIPEELCVGEYSMTELSSQAYTDNLRRDVEWHQGRFRVPPWVRVEIADPATLELYPEPGERGLIRFYDLANVDSVLAVQTSDLGMKHPDGGFELFGRAEGAELRGCSLTVEEITNPRSR